MENVGGHGGLECAQLKILTFLFIWQPCQGRQILSLGGLTLMLAVLPQVS
jgi:hypothetical protein